MDKEVVETKTMKVNEDIKPTSDSRQIESQEPGNLRELDMEVARMLEPAPPDFDPDCALLLLEPPKLSPKRGWLHVHIFDHGDVCEWEPRPFSRSIEAAMEVVEQLRDRFAFDMETWKTPAFTGWAVKLWINR